MVALSFLVFVANDIAAGASQRATSRITIVATAYSIYGKQSAGTLSCEGTAAADPRLLPLGTRVRVHGSNGYIGELVITDTGPKVKGRRIDIFFNSQAKARRFGRKRVTVEVLKWGSGPDSARRELRDRVKPPR